MSHPYVQFEGTKLWQDINKGLDDLIENQHLEETTPREYIVGHLYLTISRFRGTELCCECN